MSESEFEAELRSLRPINPTAALPAAIERELGKAPPRLTLRPAAGVLVKRHAPPSTGWWQRLAWAGAGAALAAIALLAIQRPAPHSGGASPVAQAKMKDSALFEPLASAREVIATEDAGIVFDGEAGASQIVRYSSMERHSWSNGAGALVEVEVPREDLLMIPVSYQ